VFARKSAGGICVFLALFVFLLNGLGSSLAVIFGGILQALTSGCLLLWLFSGQLKRSIVPKSTIALPISKRFINMTPFPAATDMATSRSSAGSEQKHMPLQQNEESCDVLLPERALWSCIEAMPDLSSLQASAMWSLALGASHSFEARSMISSVFQSTSPDFLIETGTFHGLTSAFMWRLCDINEKRPKVIHV